MMLARAGRLDEAVKAEEKEIAVTREVFGDLHNDVVGSLHMMAKLQEVREDWGAARAARREVISIRERQSDREDWRIADARQSLLELERLVALNPAQRQRLREADGLRQIQRTLGRQGKYADAISAARRALDIRGELQGEDHPYYASDLGNLAALYRDMGDYAKAEPLFLRALEMLKRTVSENHPNYAVCLDDLGQLYQVKGDYPRAEPLFRHALEITRRSEGEDHRNYAMSLHNLAELYRDMGDYAKAEPLLHHSLEVTKRSLGESDVDYANGLNSLGNLYLFMGDYAKAEPILRRALGTLNRTVGDNHLDYANSLASLAVLYRDMGDYAKAVPLSRHALEITRRLVGANHPTYAHRVAGLASMYMAKGDYANAEPLIRQALEIWESVKGQNNPDYAQSLESLGTLYHARCEFAKAEPVYRRALEIEERTLGENHSEYAEGLSRLAALYQAMGSYPKAESLCRRALEIEKRELGENHPFYINTLQNLGGFYYARSQLPAAEQSLSRVLTLRARRIQEDLAALSERQRIQFLTTQRIALDLYSIIAPAAGIRPEGIYRQVLAWKGAIEAGQDNDRLMRERPEMKETLEQLAQARVRLARLAFTTPPAAQRQAWRQQLDAIRNRKESLESDLARKSAEFRQVQEIRRLGAAEVAAALSPGTVLVDLFYYEHFNRSEGGKGPFQPDIRLVAFVLRRGQAPVLVPLGASRPVDEAVRAWRQALVAGKSGPMQAAALELSRRVWEPLKPHLEGAATVLVLPDGPLTQFPLAALPGRRPGTYLVEDVAIGYVTSAQRLVEILATPVEDKAKKLKADAAGLLAIGGIDYQADPGGSVPSELPPTPSVLVAESQRAAFGALAGTGPEVRHIGELFGAAFPNQHALVLTGAEPTAGVVKRQLGRHWRYLHLATHGFFESPARIAALRAGLKSEGFGLAGAGSSDESASLALAPLLHSGVALAGAARKPEDAGFAKDGSLLNREDGILTAEEVQSMDLRSTELVVLSACETALGQGFLWTGGAGPPARLPGRRGPRRGGQPLEGGRRRHKRADGAVLRQPLVQEIAKAGSAAAGPAHRPEQPRAGEQAPRGTGQAARCRRGVREATEGRGDCTINCPLPSQRSRAVGRIRPEWRWPLSASQGFHSGLVSLVLSGRLLLR